MEWITLNDGNQIPVIGFGVAMIPNDGSTRKAVWKALELGYRHIDTAMVYNNEAEVGEAVRTCGLPREQIFVTSKLAAPYNSYEEAKRGLKQSLTRMRLPYIDLYLLHQPKGDVQGAWKALEEAKEAGLVRSIGVSNMNEEVWNALVPSFTHKPAVHQVKCNPFHQQRALRACMEPDKVRLSCWYPLGHGDPELLTHPVIAEIAETHQKNPGQIILRFEVQEGFLTIPKSENPVRMKGNIEIFDFALSEAEMQAVRALDRQ